MQTCKDRMIHLFALCRGKGSEIQAATVLVTGLYTSSDSPSGDINCTLDWCN